jgi:K+-transporting ATPase ATPase C chain
VTSQQLAAMDPEAVVASRSGPSGSAPLEDAAVSVRPAGAVGEILVAIRMALVTLVLTGLAYPLAVTAAARALWPARAGGSLVTVAGRVVGSELIGQSFENPAYFQGRPSAAGPDGYDATASSGSNLGATSRKLRDRVVADLARLRRENPGASPAVPIELVTASGSGLDPHVSPQAALWQVPRVAAARRLPPADVEARVNARVEGRTLGFLGEPRVNVLLLNLDLDRRFGRPGPDGPPPGGGR